MDKKDRWVVRQPAFVAPAAGGPAAGGSPAGSGAPWCWVGAHGGAGTSTLHQVSGVGRDCGLSWPDEPARVLLVARTHAHGLRAVRRTLAARAGAVWAVVLVADAPGRLPRELRDQVRVLTGTAARLTQIPWEESWRLSPLDTSRQTLHLLSLLTQKSHLNQQ